MSFESSNVSLSAWARNAAFWDEKQGDAGSRWQRDAIAPAVERMLALEPGERVSELCCGNGGLARRLARGGATVVATDGVAELVELARARSQDLADRLTWRVVDATCEDAITALGAGSFVAAVCSMALMDIPEIAPLFRGVRALVRDGGRFVIATCHPCFETPTPTLFEERGPKDGEVVAVTRGVRITRYLSPFKSLGFAMQGQPALQPVYHRPLHAIVREAVNAGWVLDGLEELPAPPDATRASGTRWCEMPEIPPLMVLRFSPR